MYEALDNRNLATDCYKEALRNNINCFEALNALLLHGLLTSIEGEVHLIIYQVHSQKSLIQPIYSSKFIGIFYAPRK